MTQLADKPPPAVPGRILTFADFATAHELGPKRISELLVCCEETAWRWANGRAGPSLDLCLSQFPHWPTAIQDAFAALFVPAIDFDAEPVAIVHDITRRACELQIGTMKLQLDHFAGTTLELHATASGIERLARDYRSAVQKFAGTPRRRRP